jgi:hypothetical protein
MARLPKQHDNETVSQHLDDYWSYSHFHQCGPAKEVWALDDILTGISKLDFGGNTRPLSVSKLFFLLKILPLITSAAVREVLGGSESHARRISSALRIASRAFTNHIQRQPSSL